MNKVTYTYVINVAHNGKHQSEITIAQNGPDSPSESHALSVFSAMCQTFTEASGYGLRLTKVEHMGPNRTRMAG